jgi:hypothetical protein
MKKRQNMSVWLRKMVWRSTVVQFAVAGKRYNNAVALAAEESVRNMIVSDWPIIIIRPGGYMVRVQKFMAIKTMFK